MSERLKYRRMTDDLRCVIAKMYREGHKVPEIAEAVGLHETSVYRELNRGLTEELDENGNFVYDPDKARLDAALAQKNKVYYCHPYSSYERGSNENLNKMFRRLFPKGTDFDYVDDDAIIAAADWMNNYPRKVLGRTTAARRFKELLPAV